jgi:hypothetical protein
LALGRGVLAGVGFALAHLLHFGEVWAFCGSLGNALADLQSSARYRAGFDQPKGLVHSIHTGLGLVVFSPYPITVPVWHKYLYPPPFHFLGLTLGGWWPLVAVILCATCESMNISSTAI